MKFLSSCASLPLLSKFIQVILLLLTLFMPNHCYYLAISFTNHLYLYSYIYSLAMHLRYSSAPLVLCRSLRSLANNMCKLYVCPLNARVGTVFLLKTQPFRLDPTFFWYYSIKKILLETRAPNCEIVHAKCLFSSPKSYCDWLL